jgi:hypothetical protein
VSLARIPIISKREDGFLLEFTLAKAGAGMTDKPLFIRVLDSLQGCPKYAPRVPLNALQFSKKWQLRPLFLAYFCFP